jgi:chromosome segregation ATPase
MEQVKVINTPERKSGAAKWILAGAFAAMVVAGGFTIHRVSKLEAALDEERATSQKQLAELREATASSAVAMNKSFEQFSSQMVAGTKSATDSAQKAASIAQRNAEKLVAQLRDQQKEADEKFAADLGQVKSVTEEHTQKVTGLESSVGEVKQTVGTVQQDVASAKNSIDQTIADLKSVRGDLGVQSGLIATNSTELAALKELGDRNYYEFTITKKQPMKVANMTIDLKKVDTKRNKFNVDILADDKRVEKKDKTIHEPVQMYVGGGRQPYEIMVNEVKKDTIVGYVAVPKVLRATR